MSIRIVGFFVLALLAWACTGNQAGETEALRKEVIDIHDEIMPHMREIGELKETLQALEGSLAAGNGEEVSGHIAKIQAASQSLTQAEDAMRNWMQTFKYEISEDLEHEQVMDYLKGEKDKITQVKQMINQSVDSSKILITELSK